MLKANPNVSFPRNLPCLIATHCGHYDEAPGARLNSGSLRPPVLRTRYHRHYTRRRRRPVRRAPA